MTKPSPSPDLSAFERPKTCGLIRWLDANLSEEDRATLEAAFDSDYSARAIWEWLYDRKCRHTQQSVWRHRAGLCPCRPRRPDLKAAA